MEQWRIEHIEQAIYMLNELFATARGDESSCVCKQEACEKVRLYLQSWVCEPLRQSLKDKKYDYI